MPKPQMSQGAALEHERLTALINSMADGVVATDQNGRIVVYNGAALNILDINTSIESKRIDEVLHLVDSNEKKVDVLDMVSGTRTQTNSRDLRIPFGDGTFMSLYLSIAPVHLGYAQRGQSGFVLLLRDITREKSLEEERDEFISVVSHELRTPIAIAEGDLSNAILIAQKSGDIEKIKASIQQAYDQVLFLSSMINDLSTLSRAENGKLTVDIGPINAHDLMESLATNYRPSAERKGLALDLELDPKLEVLHSSKLYVREIMQNFITNAIKYTQEGRVTIGARPADGGVIFFIHDTGIGISKSDQEKIYHKFFRSEDFRTRENKGTGLGLYVTKKLARLIQAKIDLESELNKGSSFTIFVPNLTED